MIELISAIATTAIGTLAAVVGWGIRWCWSLGREVNQLRTAVALARADRAKETNQLQAEIDQLRADTDQLRVEIALARVERALADRESPAPNPKGRDRRDHLRLVQGMARSRYGASTAGAVAVLLAALGAACPTPAAADTTPTPAPAVYAAPLDSAPRRCSG
ncbi:hypothetical protein [Streptomyces albipurpureus]|uniref:Uncharacterized protein n=1 Tax=Streptomyces albipurpureus TaxID=2897419 RepID=A0ABT0UNV5_9ACTN|nr:hypothetical protein [Streptomyces sp. CWNU-1]MCM2390213.1 hypothetical protein [Streptomyces sp. CWNU-1]